MNIEDVNFINSTEYKKFYDLNQGVGYLKIRAYAASEALPVVGLNVVISTIINDRKVVFFEGTTDDSGMIDTLSLPAPKLDNNNLIVPITTTYNIEATSLDNDVKKFNVDMYDGVCVVQNINFVPGGNDGN